MNSLTVASFSSSVQQLKLSFIPERKICDCHLPVTDMVKIAILRLCAHGLTVVFIWWLVRVKDDREIDDRTKERKKHGCTMWITFQIPFKDFGCYRYIHIVDYESNEDGSSLMSQTALQVPSSVVFPNISLIRLWESKLLTNSDFRFIRIFHWSTSFHQ